jgi:hypothetical protein
MALPGDGEPPPDARPTVDESPASPTHVAPGATPTVPPPVAAEAAPTLPPPLSIAPRLAHLVLATEPTGALVYRKDGEEESLVCSTPCDVRVPAGSENETLILRAKGHRDRSLVVDLRAEARVVLAVNLDPKRAKRAKKPRKRRASGHGQAPGAAGGSPAGPAALPRLRTGAPMPLPRLRTGTSP